VKLRRKKKDSMNFPQAIDKKVWVPVLLIVVGILLRLPNLGESLWYDEVMYSTSQGAPTFSDLLKFLVEKPPAPLYRILLFFWTQCFGEHEISVRMPSLLFGVGSIFLTYLIAADQYSKKTAVTAAVMMCLSPVHVWYSQEATPYAMAGFFLLATIYSFIKLQRGHRGKWPYVIYFAMLFTAAFSHYYSLAFLLPLSLMGLWAEKRVRNRIILIHAAIVLLFAGMLMTKYLTGEIITGMGFLRSLNFFEWWMLFFHWFLHGNLLWTVNPYRADLNYLLEHSSLLAFQVGFLVIFLWGFLLDYQSKHGIHRWEYPLYLTVLPAALLILPLVGFKHLYTERYLFGLLPFFFITLSRGVTGFRNRAAVGTCITLAIVAGVVSYTMLFKKSEIWTVYKPNPDWRAAAQYLTKEKIFSKGTIVFSVTPATSLKYYLRKSGTERSIKITGYHPHVIEKILRAKNPPIFSLIQNMHWKGKSEDLLKWLKSERIFQLRGSKSFKGLELHTFKPNRRIIKRMLNREKRR
jgi:4-amino-4-deoxy-L-arabinose transferase-like glycosyltransferase